VTRAALLLLVAGVLLAALLNHLAGRPLIKESGVIKEFGGSVPVARVLGADLAGGSRH
jgi:hypothetical protein